MADSNVLSINIIGLGTPAQKVTVTQGETVGVALAKAVLEVEGMDIRINGEVATADTPVTEDSVVTAMPHVEGGF